MTKKSEELVCFHGRILGVKMEEDAEKALARILDDFCINILRGAKKIAQYSKKKEVDRKAVEISAYLASPKKLKSLK